MAKSGDERLDEPMSQFWTFSRENQDAVSLLITGRIGCDMTRAENYKEPGKEIDRFLADLNVHADAKILNIKINSSGGLAAIGLTVYENLRRHSGFKKVMIEGAAISSASLMAMAGDHISIAEDAYLRIHEVSVGIFGRAAMLRIMADHIEECTKLMVPIFCSRTGLSKSVIEDMLRNDTTFTAREALEYKFVDTVIPSRYIPLSKFDQNRVSPEHRFVNDCLTCESPCAKCLAGQL